VVYKGGGGKLAGEGVTIRKGVSKSLGEVRVGKKVGGGGTTSRYVSRSKGANARKLIH